MTGGNGYLHLLTFEHAPQRVVSLVPSMTQSLFDLGLGDRLVGVTDYCQPPHPVSERLARIGGPRSPDVDAIRSLKPDLVIANKEENSRESVEAMESAGMKVWLTFPRSVDEAMQVLWALVRLFRVPQAAPIIKTLEVTLEWTARAAASRKPVRVFCPIWRGEAAGGVIWWMTFNRHTYAHSVLETLGGDNVFADRERRYPLEADLGEGEPEEPGSRDTRYPHVTIEEIRQAAPEVILLPSEPYAFESKDGEDLKRLLKDTPAVREGRLHLIDGSLITWHGTRLARALQELPRVLEGP